MNIITYQDLITEHGLGAMENTTHHPYDFDDCPLAATVAGRLFHAWMVANNTAEWQSYENETANATADEAKRVYDGFIMQYRCQRVTGYGL